MSQTFSSFSFGCRVNQAEKEELDRQLIQLGYQYNPDNPNLYIINSCAVTNKAEREARQHINQVKKKFPEVKIVVTGCAATNWLKQKLEVPNVDVLVDNLNKEFLATLIAKKTADNGQMEAKTGIQPYYDKYVNSGRLIVKIQDGCHRFCTFCIVPYLRGLPKSIPMETIVQKINDRPELLKEVILTAINTEAYGRDTKLTFNDLLKKVLAETKIPRISFGSIHPWSINADFFDLYRHNAQSDRIVNFFHIPLQSGCDKILQIMKRGYTRAEFIEKLAILNEIRPFTFIGTDVIVGYLEETDKDFEDTYNFLEQTPIAKFHIFRYSKRQHTAAFYMGKRLKEPTPEEKQKRAHALGELAKKKYAQFLQKHVGNEFDALFLERREGEYQHVLLQNQIPAIIKSPENLVGQIKKVKIEEMKGEKLVGEVY